MTALLLDAANPLFLSLAAVLYFHFKKTFFTFLIVASWILRIIHVHKFGGVTEVMKYPFWAMSLMLTYLALTTRHPSFKIPQNSLLASAIVMVACALPLLLLLLLENVIKRYLANKTALAFAVVQIIIGFLLLLFGAFSVAIFIFTPLLVDTRMQV